MIQSGIGLPYMGSKRKLAPKIVEKIMEQNPNCQYFYDLFGGGGAITFYVAQISTIRKVFYNDLNTGIFSLLNKLKIDGIDDSFYDWVDRDYFKNHLFDTDWKGGLLKCAWCFNNDQKSYIYSKKDFELKLNCFNFLMENNLLLDTKKRPTLIEQFKKLNNIDPKFRLDLQHLEHLGQIEKVAKFSKFKKIEISNLSFDEFEITTAPQETVIYLDPPYFKTSQYQCKIDHTILQKFIENSKYKIYMSGYEKLLDSLQEVLKMPHRSTLCATANIAVEEKLFSN